MSELEDRINSLLNDPETFGKISSMARSIMGGEAAPSPAGIPEVTAPAADDSDMMRKAMHILSGMNAQPSRGRAVLQSLTPYLSESRRARMNRAMEMARLAKLAEAALAEYGGGSNGGKQI